MARKKREEHHEEHPDERWLLTYADMITLLLALFIVLFAMGSPDQHKIDPLAQSLKDALDGSILPGGKAIMRTGGQSDASELAQIAPSASLASTMDPVQATADEIKAEQGELEQLQQQIDSAAAAEDLKGKVETEMTKDGLNVRLTTDKFLFDSGSATLKPQADPIMARVARLLRVDGKHAVRVSGHTDNVPVSGQFPTNWELSTARASAVVRSLARHKVAPARMEAAGRAYLDPVGTNSSDRGRSKNRRVEILIPRQKVAIARAPEGA